MTITESGNYKVKVGWDSKWETMLNPNPHKTDLEGVKVRTNLNTS